MKFIFLHAAKHRSLPQGYAIILGACNHACPKYPKYVCISLQYLYKRMGGEVVNSGVSSQTGPKYQNQSVYNIFEISQRKHQG